MASPFDRFQNLRSFRTHLRHRPSKLGVVCGSGGGDNSYDCYDWQGSTFTTDNHAAKHKIGPTTYTGTSQQIKNTVTESFTTVMNTAQHNGIIIFCKRNDDPLNGTLWDRRATNANGKAFMATSASDIHEANDEAEKVFCGVSDCDADSIISILAGAIRTKGYHIDHADLCSIRIKPIVSEMCGYENVGMGTDDIGKDQAVLNNPQGNTNTIEPAWPSAAFADGVYDDSGGNTAYTKDHMYPTTVQCIDGKVGKPGRAGTTFPSGGGLAHGWVDGSCDNGAGPSEICKMNDMLSLASNSFEYQGVTFANGIQKDLLGNSVPWTNIKSFNEVKHALFQSRWDSYDPDECNNAGQWNPGEEAATARRSDFDGTKCTYLNGVKSAAANADGISPCNWASVGNAHPFFNGLAPGYGNPYNRLNAATNATQTMTSEGACNTLRQAFRVLNSQNNGLIVKGQFVFQSDVGIDAEETLVAKDLDAIAGYMSSAGNAIMELVPKIEDVAMTGTFAGLGVTCTELKWTIGNKRKFTSCLLSDTLKSKLYNGSSTASNVGNQIPALSSESFATYVDKSRGTATVAANPTWKDSTQSGNDKAAAVTSVADLDNLPLDEYALLLLENNAQFFADILGLSNNPAKDLLTAAAYLTERKEAVSDILAGKAGRQNHLTRIMEQMGDTVDSDAIRERLTDTILRHYKAIVA